MDPVAALATLGLLPAHIALLALSLALVPVLRPVAKWLWNRLSQHRPDSAETEDVKQHGETDRHNSTLWVKRLDKVEDRLDDCEKRHADCQEKLSAFASEIRKATQEIDERIKAGPFYTDGGIKA